MFKVIIVTTLRYFLQAVLLVQVNGKHV